MVLQPTRRYPPLGILVSVSRVLTESAQVPAHRDAGCWGDRDGNTLRVWRVTHSHPNDIQYIFPQFTYRNGTLIVGMLLGSSVKPAHWFVTPVVRWLVNKLFKIPPKELSRCNYPVNSLSIFYSCNYRHSINVVTISLFHFRNYPTVGLFDCPTVYTNLLISSQRIQLHLIRSNWSTGWLINSLQLIDSIKPSLT
jgi:hypothetical protein